MATGAPDRTLVVAGVPDVLAADRMVDKLTVHFQHRRRSHGGDVETVEYPTNLDGVAFVTFDVAEDAERAAQKEEQIMKDDTFTKEYRLTVFPFSSDVFFYVSSATLDLSFFGSKSARLIQSLRSAHRSVHFQRVPQQSKATIHGPFVAIRALRHDLRLRAMAYEGILRETTLLKVSGHGSATYRHPAGEVTDGSLANTETQNSEAGKGSVQSVSLQSKFRHQMVCREPGVGAQMRQHIEANKRPGTDHISETGKTAVDPLKSGDGHLKGSAESDSMVAAKVRGSSKSDPEHLCMWVDSDTFRYMEAFHREDMDSCLRGVSMSVESDKANVTQILLSGTWTSEVQQSLDLLKALVAAQQTNLRAYCIPLAAEENPEQLLQICRDINSLFGEILYILVDRSIRVIGPPAYAQLFYMRVRERISELRLDQR